jgi:hypothetical protein
LNPGRRGGKPATNRLSYGAAMLYLHKYQLFVQSAVYQKFREIKFHLQEQLGFDTSTLKLRVKMY